MSQLEQDITRLQTVQQRREQQRLQTEYAPYLPEGAVVTQVQEIPRERVSPSFVPPSETEYRGGYTEVSYLMPQQPSEPEPTAPAFNLEEELRKQLPEGANLTYYTETEPGKYAVSYTMPQEPSEQTKMFRADMAGPIEDFLKRIFEAPSLAELNQAMKEDVAGVGIPITTEDILTASITLASVAAPILQKKFWPTSQQQYYQAMSKMSKELYGPTSLEKIGLAQSPNAEMWLNVQQPLETSQFQPAEQWYRVTRGTPTTPMSKTLEATLYGTAKGGLSAEQILVPRSEWIMPPALKGLTMHPKITPTTRIFPFIGLPSAFKHGFMQTTVTIQGSKAFQQLKTPTRLFEKQNLRLLQRNLVVPETAQLMKAANLTQTSQVQAQQQIQRMMQAQQTALRTAQSQPGFPSQISKGQPTFKMPSRLPESFGVPKGGFLGSRYWIKRHPIPTPRQVLGFSLGSKKRRKK